MDTLVEYMGEGLLVMAYFYTEKFHILNYIAMQLSL